MRRCILPILCVCTVATAAAQVAPVTLRVPETQAWVGECVWLVIELRAPGSFAGAASFDLPAVPGGLLIRVGNPVVSSETKAEETVFVQTHRLALFSQRSGDIEVPPFTARFSHRKGFTGDPIERVEQVDRATVRIVRPPGTEDVGFLVTTDSLEVTQTWDPEPADAPAGSIVRRTISQTANAVSGMALAPAPAAAPAGVKVYTGAAETQDQTARGAFVGARTESLRYLLSEPGTVQLPALRYRWWDATAEEMRSITLPGATVEVAALAAAAAGDDAPASGSDGGRLRWWWLPAVLLLAWSVRTLRGASPELVERLDPPHRRARRHLLRACRRSDAAAADRAWRAWRAVEFARRPAVTDALGAAVLDLQRVLYGRERGSGWSGDALGRAVRSANAAHVPRVRRSGRAGLPDLNP